MSQPTIINIKNIFIDVTTSKTNIEYYNKDIDVEPVIHYSRAYSQIIISLLVIGISPIGIGFGMYGVIISISNLMLGVFNCTNNLQPVISPIQEQS